MLLILFLIMGIFACDNCEKDFLEKITKDDNEEDDKNINENDKITNLNPAMDISQNLYNKIVEKDPLDDYEIIKIISNFKSQVSSKEENEKNIYTMEKLGEYRKDINNIINEILKLNHKYIIKINSIYKYLNNYYIIYENFENNLIEKGEINVELKFRKEIIENLIQTINYLHEQNIYNIGLNFDNLFLRKEMNQEEKITSYFYSLSIIDILKSNYDMILIHFYSPEVIRQIYLDKKLQKEINNKSNRNDEWSCGLFLYYLITNELPFKGKDIEELYNSLENTNLDLSSPKFNRSCEEEKDLLKKLLEKDEKKRISISECLFHSYITEKITLDLKDNEDIDMNLLNNLLNIKKPASKFHEIIIEYLIANFINEEEKNKINYLFNYIDTDKDNKITEDDLVKVFDKTEMKYTKEQIKYILNVFDYDIKQCIQLKDFLRNLCNKDELFKEENLKKVFNAIDTEQKNYIEQKDVINFIISEYSINDFSMEKDFMEQFGMNFEDKIVYEEFSEAIRNNKNLEKKNEIINEK